MNQRRPRSPLGMPPRPGLLPPHMGQGRRIMPGQQPRNPNFRPKSPPRPFPKEGDLQDTLRKLRSMGK